MALDPRIALLTNVPNYSDTFYKGLMQGQQVSNTAEEQPVRNRLLEAQATGAEQEVRKRDWDYEFDSVLRKTLELEQLIGLEGELSPEKKQEAVDFLTKNAQEIQARGGVVDDTQLAIDLLRDDNIEKLRRDMQNIKSVGIQTGRLTGLKDKSFTLSPGQTRYDSAGNPVASADPKPDITTLQKNLQAAGLTQGTPEYQTALLKAIQKPGVQVSIGDEAEGTERKEIAKVRARQFEKLSNDADNAESTLASLDQLDAVDAKTGAFEPAKAAFAAIAEGFGFDAGAIANVTTAQALEGLSNRLVNDVLNAAKGPQTEGDALRARSTLKSLGDDPRAGQFKSDSLRAVALRTVEQREFIDQKIDAGSTFSAARADWNKFKKKTPSLSAVVKNPNTGLPLFYYQFKRSATQRRPGITDEQIIAAWRKAHD